MKAKLLLLSLIIFSFAIGIMAQSEMVNQVNYSDQSIVPPAGSLFLSRNQTDGAELFPNYPNPFTSTTTISYSVSQISYVDIRIYDMLGKEIITLVDGFKPSGLYQIEFNATDLPKGYYFIQMKADDFTATRKIKLDS